MAERTLDRDQVLDLWARSTTDKNLRAVYVAAHKIVEGDPADWGVGRGRVENLRLLAAAKAAVHGGEVCSRCGGTGTYGHYGVCFDCGGRGWH